MARIWNWCDPSTFLGPLHAELLGSSATPRQIGGWPYIESGGTLCYYLVGYCPIQLSDKFPGYAVFNSLWLPGMQHTPEYDSIVSERRLDSVDRGKLDKRVSATMMKRLEKSRDFEAIRMLHQYAPQVKPIQAKVFGYPWLPD